MFLAEVIGGNYVVDLIIPYTIYSIYSSAWGHAIYFVMSKEITLPTTRYP